MRKIRASKNCARLGHNWTGDKAKGNKVCRRCGKKHRQNVIEKK